MKRAYEVLSCPEVNSGFAADRGIDLGNHRCRNLYQRNASQISCCCKSGQVSHNTTAEGDHRIATLKSRIGKKLQCFGVTRERLESFAIAHQPMSDSELAIPQTSNHNIAVKPEDFLIRDEDD